MRTPHRLASIVVASSLLAAACTSSSGPDALAFESATSTVPVASAQPLTARNAIEVPSVPLRAAALTVDGDRFALETPAGTHDFLNGINLGATVPGHQPGELAPTADDIGRWLAEVSKFGFDVIRVYTIQQPHFYDELLAFNEANPESPLYVMHGVWIPEADFFATEDLFADAVRNAMRDEIGDAVAAVHGDVELPERRGHASGLFTSDVSDWLAGWILGVEMDPLTTHASNVSNAGQPPYAGSFFRSSPEANPTEVWFAEMLDVLATEMHDRHLHVPVAFTNWPTTDPLRHPDEPVESEDLVQLDANHVEPSTLWEGGYFASYHAYPYYPDFQRYETGIVDHVAANGEVDSYAGYLNTLRSHHESMPVLISEFGVPSGSAHAHAGPQGRNQGDYSEQQQSEVNADLLRVIHDEGLAGAMLFEWTDEWFKFTWNTFELELPAERRGMWTSPWTNEAHFGLVAVEPGLAPPVIIDGNPHEWATNESQYISEAPAGVYAIQAVKDEAYLYLNLTLQEPFVEGDTLVIGVDVLAEDGGGLPRTNGAAPNADYAIVLDGPTTGTALVASYNNPTRILAGTRGWIDDWRASELTPNQSLWHVQQLITNRPLTVPTTGEQMPIELIEPGRLIAGTSDPADPAFDARATFAVNGTTIEMRLPYTMIGLADPSSLQAYRIGDDGSVSTRPVERVGLDVVVNNLAIPTNGYAWDPWQSVTWHERLKVGAEQYAEAMAATEQ